MKEVGVKVDYCIEFDVFDDVIVECMGGCCVYLVLGCVYYVVYNLFKEEGKDDVSGEDLIICDDDKEEMVCKCFVIYYE